jgi:DNA-binding CsgD family transcriptional regulator
MLERYGPLVSPPAKIATDYILLGVFAIAFLVSARDSILIFATIGEGFINIYFGGDLMGLIFCAFGLSIALKKGWFRTNLRIKLNICIAFFVLILVLQFLKLGLHRTIITGVNLILATGLISSSVYLFYDHLSPFLMEKKTLDLREKKLTERQITCVRGVMAQKSTREIAAELIISPSVVKKELVNLYDIFGVEDYVSLYSFLSEYTVLF